jgi:hypothetical protein
MAPLLIEHVAASGNSEVSLKLFGPPGGAENVVAWMNKFPNGCLLESRSEGGDELDQLRENDIPESLCFWYENGTFLATVIKGRMCNSCYQILVAEFVTMTATYTAGYIGEDGKWVDEDFDAEIFSPGAVNAIGPHRKPRIPQSSYEEIAALQALREDGRPFYYDKACLIDAYDPQKDAKEENDRIWRKIEIAYNGCIANYGFEGGGENCIAERRAVGDKYHQLSRIGIYVSASKC